MIQKRNKILSIFYYNCFLAYYNVLNNNIWENIDTSTKIWYNKNMYNFIIDTNKDYNYRNLNYICHTSNLLNENEVK